MRTNEMKVGLALVISLAILIGGIFWGKGYRLSSSRYTIHVVFNGVGGMEEGANVMANGVVKGRVKNIEFREGSVLVTATLDNDVKIFADYMVTIEAPTVMAGNALSVYTGGQPPEVDLTEPLTGQDPMGMSAMVTRVQDFADKIETTLSHLNTLLINMNTVMGDTVNQANMNELLAEAAESARQTSELLAENRQTITESLDKLDSILENTRGITETANAHMETTINNVDSAMSAIAGLATDLRAFLASMKDENSTLGKLLTDDELYIRLTHALAEVDSLSVSLRTRGLRQRIVFF